MTKSTELHLVTPIIVFLRVKSSRNRSLRCQLYSTTFPMQTKLVIDQLYMGIIKNVTESIVSNLDSLEVVCIFVCVSQRQSLLQETVVSCFAVDSHCCTD